jgi:hypothetical protein
VSFYTCFDWFKKLRLFSYVLNLRIDVVLKAARAVVIRRFSLNETPLELSKFIYDYLSYFEKFIYFDKYFLNIIIITPDFLLTFFLCFAKNVDSSGKSKWSNSSVLVSTKLKYHIFVINSSKSGFNNLDLIPHTLRKVIFN